MSATGKSRRILGQHATRVSVRQIPAQAIPSTRVGALYGFQFARVEVYRRRRVDKSEQHPPGYGSRGIRQDFLSTDGLFAVVAKVGSFSKAQSLLPMLHEFPEAAQKAFCSPFQIASKQEVFEAVDSTAIPRRVGRVALGHSDTTLHGPIGSLR